MATRKINTKRLVHDIRFGMIDPYIRIKHRLSYTTLRTLFGGLYREKDVTPSRLYETSRTHGKGVGYIPVKRTPRTETMDDPPVPMYDVESSFKGILAAISETRLKEVGVTASVGARRLWLAWICSPGLFPSLFSPICRFTIKTGKTLKCVESSTEVTSISRLLELPGPRPLAPTPIRGSPGSGLRQDSQDHYRAACWN